MALAALIREDIAKRLRGYAVFTESQTQYSQFPAILIETQSIRTLDNESHYVKQVSLVITIMLKVKKNVILEIEMLCDQIVTKMERSIPGTLSHQWLETTFEQYSDQEQPLVIAKLHYSILIEGN
jgi:hypothetical protein